MAGLTLHVPEAVLRHKAEAAKFYGPLAEGFAARGVAVQMVLHERTTALERVTSDAGFHIVDFGRVNHPRALNTASAYLPPYRYFDPKGVRAFSSLGDLAFSGGDGALFEPLREAFVTKRRSRYAQLQELSEVPIGCIAVFLQSEGMRGPEETCYLTMRQMVKTLLERADPRPIVIKPHPRDMDLDTLGWLGQKARKDARLVISMGNIHDILARADVVVTINSAVGIEAFLHRRPVVLCGAADFHHCCEVVKRRGDLDAGIARAEARAGDWPFEAYIGWFFGQQCLNPQAADFHDRLIARIAGMGFDFGVQSGRFSAR